MSENKTKVTLSLSDEALRRLDLLTSERKRGEFVSELIAKAFEARALGPMALVPVPVAEKLRELAALLVV